jgi:hypothetical protein
MTEAPLAAQFALELTRTHVNSARPHAPVVTGRGTRRRRRRQKVR